MEKLKKPFINGVKAARHGKDVMQCFAEDYPNIDSEEANRILPSYREGFEIGEDEGELEEDRCDPENHFKVWVNPDALRIEAEAKSNKRYKDYLKNL